MRIEQAVKKEGEKSEREQAKQEAMKLVEGLLAAEGMELKKPTANPDTLNVSFFVTDHAGTPGKLIDERGEILWEAEADDWGAVRNEKGVRQPIRFQGQWLDEESGFYYNRYRYYDPRQGRYVTQDPIGLRGGLNVYSYPANPVGRVDPKGLATELALASCVAGGPFNPVCSGAILVNVAKWVGIGAVALGGALGVGTLLSSSDSPAKTKDKAQEKSIPVSPPNPCAGYPSRTDANLAALNCAGVNSDWTRIGWEMFNKPKPGSPDERIYAEFRKWVGSDPYGYSGPTGGEIVEHPADGQHPCPHFHAKPNLYDSSTVFPYDPFKPM
jgi:RHS repeat-associated protein